MKTVALIPLRGKSKRIPRKEIKDFCGKPLCYWTLKACCDCERIHEVWVSTHDQEIKEVVNSFDMGIKILDRPEYLAADEATTESVMLHFAEHVEFDTLVTAQVTSPFTTKMHLTEALEMMEAAGADSVVTGVKLQRFMWEVRATGVAAPLYNPYRRPWMYQLDEHMVENGAFYITRRWILEHVKCRVGGEMLAYGMPEYMMREIDYPEDWIVTEKFAREQLLWCDDSNI
jgi:N-acylneuraminate cytidylyltransferase